MRGKGANEIHLYENKNIPSISSQRVSLYMLPLDTHIEKGHIHLSGKSHGTEYVQHMHAFYAVSFRASVFVIYILYRNIYSTKHLKSYPSLESRLFYYQLNVL